MIAFFRFFLLLGVLLSANHFALGQTKVLDSLQNRLKVTTSDTAKINLMNKINSILVRKEYELAVQKTKETIALSQKNDYLWGEMIASRLLGLAYSELRKKDSAFFYINKAMSIYPKVAEQDKNKHNEKSNYSALGNINENLGLAKNALNAFLKCLKLAEETHDTARIASMLNGIGIIHKSENDLNKAKEYWTRATEMASHTNNVRLQASTNTNLGIAYVDRKEYAKALVYLEKSNALTLKSEGKPSKFVLYNSGQAYLGLENYSKARACFEEVLAIAEKDKDVIREVLALKGLSDVAVSMQKWNLAISWGNKAVEKLAIAKDMESSKKVYEVLFKAYQGAGQFEKALDYHIFMNEAKDSLFNLERTKELNELETKYEVEKKETENTLLKKDKDLKDARIRQQMWVIVSTLIIIGLVVFLSIILYRSRQKEKDINVVLADQKIELQSKNRLLEELNAVKDRLFSIISHDLRAPLGSLKGLLTLLNDKTLSEAQVTALFPKLSQDVGYTSDLLDSLLHWAKSQLHGIHTNPKKIDMKALVEENISLLSSIAEQKNIELTNEIGENALVLADEDMTRTILRNLVSNALKFTKANGHIRVSAQTLKEGVEVTVEDTGVGMSQEVLSQLFKGNVTTRGTKNEKGTGLGLMLVKDFIEKNNGTIRVESEVGKGSKFIFTLPLAEEKVSTMA
jgi:signal transduction histidine kinase